MASEEKHAFLKSVLIDVNSSEQEVKQAYLQLALQHTSHKSSKKDERSHAARLRDITALFLNRVPAEKYQGHSDEEILFHVFKDAFSFTFKDNSQSGVLESSSSPSGENGSQLNGPPTTNVQDSSPQNQATPNIFDILEDKSVAITSKQECIQDTVVDPTGQSQVKAESEQKSEEIQSCGASLDNRPEQQSVSSFPTGVAPEKTSNNGYSPTNTASINEIDSGEKKTKEIDLSQGLGQSQTIQDQLRQPECAGLQAEPSTHTADSVFGLNSAAINMSQWNREDGQKGAWSNGSAVTSTGWTPMDSNHGQSQDGTKGNTSQAPGVMNSIWGSSSSGGATSTSSSWGSAASATSSSSFQPGLFPNATSNGHGGGSSSVWSTPTSMQSGGGKASLPFGGSNQVSMPSSTSSSSNPVTSMSSGWDTSASQNGVEPSAATTPTSTASNPALPTSQVGGGSGSGSNSGNGGNGGTTPTSQESQQQQQMPPVSTPNTTLASGMPGTGDLDKEKAGGENSGGQGQQRPTSQGWGMPPGQGSNNGFNQSRPGADSSWGNPGAQKDSESGWQKPGSSWGSNNPSAPPTLTGTSAWGAAPTGPPSSGGGSGWGNDHPGQSHVTSAGSTKPWGGGANPVGSSRGWGASSAGPNEMSGTGGWGKPPPSNEGTSGWGMRPPSTPTSGGPPGGPPGPPGGWSKDGPKDGGQPPAPGWGNRQSGWGNQPPQPPGPPGPPGGPDGSKKDHDIGSSGWGKPPSGGSSWGQSANKGGDRPNMHRNPVEPQPVDPTQIAALVKTPWGKRPINQEVKWDSQSQSQGNPNQSGTTGWGTQPPSQDRQWEKAEQPKQSAWGKPPNPPHPPQTPTESSWGAQPPTPSGPTSSQPSGWGPPKERSESQDSGWGHPPTSSAPSGPTGPPGPPGGPPSGPPSGPPPSSGPPGPPGPHGPPSTSGFSSERSSPPHKDMETASNASSGTPQPSDDPSQMLPGPPPKKIVATGWGDGPMMERVPLPSQDNGTSHWGDPMEHNRRLTRRQAGGHLPQMGGNPQNSTMQGGPPSAGPQGDSPMMPNPPPSQFKPDNQWEDKSKQPTSWGDFPNQRSGSTSSGGGSSMWNTGGAGGSSGSNKWDQSSTSSWGPSSSTSGSTQSKDSMQQNWQQEDSSSGSIAVGHWGEEEWETRSQSGDSSMSAGWRGGQGGPKKPRPTGQRESNHYISKLKRLMDYNFPKEVAEVALRKHSFHFESALAELQQLSNMMEQNKPSGDLDDPMRQMTRTMNNLGLGESAFSDPKLLSSGNDLTNANMLMNNSLPGSLPIGGKPNNMMGNQGFMQSAQRFNSVSQQQNLLMGQQPASGASQPMRGPFNQPQQAVQQQQQLFNVLLQLAVQSGIVNQNLLQQQVSPQQIMNIVQRYPQLLAQAQAQQNNLPPVGGPNISSKSMGSTNRAQQEQLMARLLQQQVLQGQRPPVSRQPFPTRPKMRSDSDVFPNTTQSDLLGNIGSMNADLGARQQSRMQQFFGKTGTKNFPPSGRTESVPGLPDPSRRGSNWSRSNSPTPSDSLPTSADSTFSDSGWSFPQQDSLSSAIGDDVPEFIPGVPWNPTSSLDVSNDPTATPGMFASSKSAGRDQVQKDDISGILTRPMKPQSSWSNQPGGRKSSWNYTEPGSGGFPGGGAGAGARSNQLWSSGSGNQQRAPRPPPGLGSSWSSGNGASGSNSIVISGITPDMNLSTLRSICTQQGEVEQFQENRSQGSVMVSYRFPDDAAKAQSMLSGMPGLIVSLGDTFSAPSSGPIASSSSSGWPQGGGDKFRNGGLSSSASGTGKDDSSKQNWNAGLPSMPGSQLWSPGPTSNSMGWSPMDGDSGSGSSFSFLPGDLLGEGTN